MTTGVVTPRRFKSVYQGDTSESHLDASEIAGDPTQVIVEQETDAAAR